MSEWVASIMTSDRHRQRSSDRRRNRRAGLGSVEVDRAPVGEYRTFRISTLCQCSTSPGRGRGLCVRPHRYALALATGEPLGTTLALYDCDLPVCVKVA